MKTRIAYFYALRVFCIEAAGSGTVVLQV